MRARPAVILLAGAIFLATTAFGREAGWVPLPKEAWQPDLKSSPSSSAKKARKAKPAQAAPAKGATVYDRQPPVTEPELAEFIITLPKFRAWARQNHEEAHPIVNPSGQPDFLYSPKAAAWVKDNGFEPARFFCIMGRMAAGLVIIEEGNDLKETRPRDMPDVDQQEVSLARRHLGELLTAAGAPAN